MPGAEIEFSTEFAKSCQSRPLGVWDAQALLLTPLERRERSRQRRPAIFDDFGVLEAASIYLVDLYQCVFSCFCKGKNFRCFASILQNTMIYADLYEEKRRRRENFGTKTLYNDQNIADKLFFFVKMFENLSQNQEL